MAVRFGTDGTLYCNSIKRNWIAASNLIGYGCGTGLTTGVSGQTNWTTSGTVSENFAISSLGSSLGSSCPYEFCYFINAASSTLYQKVSVISGHKYYVSFWYYISGSYDVSLQSPFGAISMLHGGSSFRHHFDVYTASTTQTANFGWSSGQRGYPGYITGMMILDLTANVANINYFTDNEWRTWCNTYLRENRTFQCRSSVTNTSRIRFSNTDNFLTSKTSYNAGVASGGDSEYKSFKERYYRGTTEDSEYTLKNGTSLSGIGSSALYFQTYAEQTGLDYQSYNPTYNQFTAVSHPGHNIPVIKEFPNAVNGRNFIMISDYCLDGYNPTTYLSFKTVGTTGHGEYVRYSYWGSVGIVQDYIDKYNDYYDIDLDDRMTISDVNKQWLDCWCDGYTQPVLHLPDPSIRKIVFNTTYDVECSDVVIENNLNRIYFDEAGRIHCRKLSPTQTYKPMA